ncbi:MAG: glutathione synthase [Oleiphilaceae bacterium]|nr:glutathione synthase [Oleiphilaceae bacterium]
MTIKLGIVMDPIATINIKKDSTFAMALAAQKKGWDLYYIELADMYLDQGLAKASVRPLTVERDPAKWFDLGPQDDIALHQLDVILMRKDPPVDAEFIYATHILERAEEQGTLIVNRARALRDCNEKLYATAFPQCCPPVLVSREPERLRAFHRTHRDVIFKPLDGMGGKSIFRAREDDPNLSVILETLTQHGQQQIMAQSYLPAIKDGDKRILIIDGEPVSHALARIPGAGESRGNLAAGGKGLAVPLTERDRWIVEQIRPDLKKRGLIFVGIDVIGDYLTEINVTSPTCIQELDQACQLDIAGDLMAAIERHLDAK